MSTVSELINKIKEIPDTIEFNEVMAVIDAAYKHTPTAFTNGEVENGADQNQGSCKILSFARLNGLTESETLACFGRFYRDEVLNDPEGTGHGNIRAFMKTGWSGVSLPDTALVAKG